MAYGVVYRVAQRYTGSEISNPGQWTNSLEPKRLLHYSEDTEFLQGPQGLSGRLHGGHSPRSCRSSTLPSWPGASNTSGRAQAAASWGGWTGQWQSRWTWRPGREERRHQFSHTTIAGPKDAPLRIVLSSRFAAFRAWVIPCHVVMHGRHFGFGHLSCSSWKLKYYQSSRRDQHSTWHRISVHLSNDHSLRPSVSICSRGEPENWFSPGDSPIPEYPWVPLKQAISMIYRWHCWLGSSSTRC